MMAAKPHIGGGGKREAQLESKFKTSLGNVRHHLKDKKTIAPQSVQRTEAPRGSQVRPGGQKFGAKMEATLPQLVLLAGRN